MLMEPEKLGKMTARILEALRIRSEIGKVLFGLECLLTVFLMFALSIFALHDIIMTCLKHPGEQAWGAFQWGLGVILISMVLVMIRELIVKRMV